MAIRTYISKITLNVNGQNAPTKRHRLAEWIQKQDKEKQGKKNKNTLKKQLLDIANSASETMKEQNI